MTALRPERDAASPYGDPYGGGDSSAFEAAVGRLDDPLTDPLPGRPARSGQATTADPQGGRTPGGPQGAQAVPAQPIGTYVQEPGGTYVQEPIGTYVQGPAGTYVQEPGGRASAAHPPPQQPETGGALAEQTLIDQTALSGAAAAAAGQPLDQETVALRVPGSAGRTETAVPPPGEGRAARRKAAKRGGGGRAGHGGHGGHRAKGHRAPRGTAAAASSPAVSGVPRAPLTRMEARRQAQALKDPPGVVASRVTGELFITFGVLMLLFVAYQLWYTNVLAHQEAGGAASNLQKQWGGSDRRAGAFEPGQGFAILYIPKLDVKAPIAEGVDKHKVLDRGMVGHYDSGTLKTAMPWDKKGNFAVAGHRNTHGEPFRYINRLKPGDEIIVETQSDFYTYEMTSRLPQTPPSNTAVLRPVPQGSGFTKSGRYITLTTCTPEFTSTYRLIVWGKMVEERPRSKGKPDALLG